MVLVQVQRGAEARVCEGAVVARVLGQATCMHASVFAVTAMNLNLISCSCRWYSACRWYTVVCSRACWTLLDNPSQLAGQLTAAIGLDTG